MLHRRSRQFEEEQAELHQKLAALQGELAVLNQQYGSLLEQVGQQHSLIRQLSEVQDSQNPGEGLGHMECKETQAAGECELAFRQPFCRFNLEAFVLNRLRCFLDRSSGPT